MMLIDCPFCGPRAELEFTCGGESHIARPANQEAMSDAEWADYLVVATPGGASTRHLINAGVLAALGSNGYVVNVSRGSVVDTAALADALERGVIAGAGLDVYEGEPAPPWKFLHALFVAQAHLVVEVLLATDIPAVRGAALVPVLAVVLLEYA